MIECPICHVQNDDRSLFCAECGQRFSGQAAAPGETTAGLLDPPSLQNSPKRPAVKLHSPILDGGGHSDQAPSRPRPFGKSGGDASDAVRPKRPAPNNDSDFNQPGDANPPTHRKGLRSPLLDFDDEDIEGEYQPNNNNKGKSSGGGMFPHRSNSRLNNTGGQPVDQEDLSPSPRPTRPSKGLRSPLLGGDDEYEEMDDTPPLMTNKGTPSRLRSPVLGGGRGQKFQSQPDYDEVVEDENPNLLRSPLLAARAPMQDRIKPAAPAAEVKPPEQNPQGTNNPWGNPPGGGFGAGANLAQPPQVGAAPAPDFSQNFGQPQPSLSNSTFADPQALQAGAPLAVNPDPLPQWNAGSTLGSQQSSSAANPAMVSGGFGTLPPAVPTPPKAPAPSSYDAPVKSSLPLDSDTESSGAVRGGARSYGDASPSKRSVTSSRLLPVNDESHAPPSQPPGYAAFGKFMALPLGASVAFKLWYLHDMGATAFSSPSFLADQLGQAVVIICVLVFTFMVSSEPRR